MIGADLHTHTTASDGELAPAALAAAAAAAGLAVIAVTDHDTMAGTRAAQSAGRELGIEVVAGVEISSNWRTEDGREQTVHLLGYFCDPASPAMRRLDAAKRDSRQGRARAMVARLAELGVEISFDRVAEIAAGAQIGRPHIARAVIEAGYESDWNRVFARWLGNDAPAYVGGEPVSVADAIGKIRSAGGLAVIAHPYYDFHNRRLDLEGLLPEACSNGLVGLEVFYGDFCDRERSWALEFARRFDLIPTGGSDYHGPASGNNPLGTSLCPPQNWRALSALADPTAGLRNGLSR